MKKLFTLAIFALLSLQVLALPWGHRYATEQATENITIDISTLFTVSVEWGEGDWDADGSKFGYGTSIDGTGWTWVDLPWFADGGGSNKLCKTNLSIDTPGKYYYAYRMDKSGTTYSLGTDSWAENVSSLAATAYILVGDVSKQDGAWNDTNTWEDGSVPISTSNVGIYHAVTLSASAQESASLNITSGKSLTINVGGQLTTGAITNSAGNSGLIIKSDAAGNGSLIFSGAAPAATVERYIAGHSGVAADGWHFLSSPITTFTVFGSDFQPTLTEDDLYEYDEVSNMWLNYHQGNAASFTAGEGFLVARKATTIGDFIGTLNSGAVTFDNLTRTASKGNGFHLLGNPFTSAIIWKDGNWALTNIGAIAQIWNASSGNFSLINSGGFIPSTNGFYVETDTDLSNTITISASSRAHNATNNYKSEDASNKMLMKINNDVNSYSDQCVIGFKQEATEAFDLEFDSHKLYGNAKAPQLCSKIGEEVFSTNYLPELESDYYFNLEFKAGVDANYTINFEGIDSFESDIFMTLVDLKTNTYTDLRTTADYSFSASTSDDVDRFVIHAFKSTLGLDEMENDLLKVYAYQDLVMVQNKTNKAGQMQVFDLSGRKIYEAPITNEEQSSYRLACPSGAYIIHIEAGERSVRETIIIATK